MEDNPFEEYASLTQISIIEGLLTRNSVSFEEKCSIERELFDVSLTFERAVELIEYLRENEIYTDPLKQFNKFKF